jgi:hypothetical protein
MKIAAVAIATLLVIVGAVAARLNRPNQTETLSLEVESQEGVSLTPAAAPTSEPTVAKPTKPTDEVQAPSGNISEFVYPGAKILTQTQNSVTLESLENADKITYWYKDKIVGLGMSVKSFVTTKANDKVLNKLAGADGKREIAVEISKDSGIPTVKISVSLENF